MQEKTDEEMVSYIISHSNFKNESEKRHALNSYSILMDRYDAKLSRYIKKFIYDIDDASDMLQDVFVKAFQNLNSFNSSYKFNSWIYRIAHNECINYLKKNKKEGISFVDIDTVMPILFAKETSDNIVISDENKRDVEKVLNKLDSKYREIIVLNFFEDLSYGEISDILKIPISTVGVRVKRAKEKIKKLLEEDNYKHTS